MLVWPPPLSYIVLFCIFACLVFCVIILGACRLLQAFAFCRVSTIIVYFLTGLMYFCFEFWLKQIWIELNWIKLNWIELSSPAFSSLLRSQSSSSLKNNYDTMVSIYFVSSTCKRLWCILSLWFLCNIRINLSPFTKDFRAEEQIDESVIIFQCSAPQQS